MTAPTDDIARIDTTHGAAALDTRVPPTTEVLRTDATFGQRGPATPEGAPEVIPDTSDEGAPSRLIRPYAMVGGRTGGHSDISLESQIQTSTRAHGDGVKYRWEAAKILKLAEQPMALVELAARIEIPIGVARVVISDLVDAGAVNVQRNSPVMSYTSLLEKVLDGIRDL